MNKVLFHPGLIYLLSGPASPALGFLLDKTGRNIFYCVISIVITLLCHMMLTFSYWNPFIAIVCMGFGYSLLASALWPIAAFIIPEHQLGSAYGLMQVKIMICMHISDRKCPAWCGLIKRAIVFYFINHRTKNIFLFSRLKLLFDLHRPFRTLDLGLLPSWPE